MTPESNERKNILWKYGLIAIGLLVLSIGIALVSSRATPVPGNFPRSFSETEKQEVVSVAIKAARLQALAAIKRGDFRLAWHWIRNSRIENISQVGYMGSFIDIEFDPNHLAVNERQRSYTWSDHVLKKEAGHWVVVQSSVPRSVVGNSSVRVGPTNQNRGVPTPVGSR